MLRKLFLGLCLSSRLFAECDFTYTIGTSLNQEFMGSIPIARGKGPSSFTTGSLGVRCGNNETGVLGFLGYNPREGIHEVDGGMYYTRNFEDVAVTGSVQRWWYPSGLVAPVGGHQDTLASVSVIGKHYAVTWRNILTKGQPGNYVNATVKDSFSIRKVDFQVFGETGSYNDVYGLSGTPAYLAPGIRVGKNGFFVEYRRYHSFVDWMPSRGYWKLGWQRRNK